MFHILTRDRQMNTFFAGPVHHINGQDAIGCEQKALLYNQIGDALCVGVDNYL
jgi:hypothetical protein